MTAKNIDPNQEKDNSQSNSGASKKDSGAPPKTETSRLKIPKPDQDETAGAKVASGDQSDAETRPVSSRKDDDSKVTDPMSLRDTNTSKVRRVSGGKSAPDATAVTPGSSDSGEEEHKTETVQLKVVQEKKKQIADMMNPSNTVRLRSPGGKKGKGGIRSGTGKVSAAESDSSGESGVQGKPKKKQDTKPESTQPRTAEAGDKSKTSTQPLKKLTAKKEGAEGKESEAGKTVKARGDQAAKSGGRTLKIKKGGRAAKQRAKARSGASEDEPSQTVKLSSSEATGKAASSEAGKTVKADEKPGLRLKQRPEAAAETEETGAPAAQPAVISKAEAEPGIALSVANVAAFVATGVLLYFLIQQAITHIW